MTGLRKAHVVHPGEQEDLVPKRLGLALTHEQPTGLGHGLEDQHPGHDRQTREMALKKRLVDRHVLDGP
jgi:hypothetical protein